MNIKIKVWLSCYCWNPHIKGKCQKMHQIWPRTNMYPGYSARVLVWVKVNCTMNPEMKVKMWSNVTSQSYRMYYVYSECEAIFEKFIH